MQRSNEELMQPNIGSNDALIESDGKFYMFKNYTEFTARQIVPKTVTSPSEYLAFARKEMEAIMEILAKKNHDYTAGSGDAFANFRQSEDFGVNTMQGVALRMGDKWQRIRSFLKLGELKSESLEDALRDNIGYSLIMLALLQEK